MFDIEKVLIEFKSYCTDPFVTSGKTSSYKNAIRHLYNYLGKDSANLYNVGFLSSLRNDLKNKSSKHYLGLSNYFIINQIKSYLEKGFLSAGIILFIDFIHLKNEETSRIKSDNEFETSLNSNNSFSITQKDQLKQSRIGQGVFRNKLISKYNGSCVITKVDKLDLLFASHIKPWASSSNLERLDEHNGLLLSPIYDKLFDSGYISFDDSGKIMLSNYLTPAEYLILKISKNDFIDQKISKETKKYLQFHREHVFKK